MRDLNRNKRSLWYAVPEGTQPILDDYGNDTLEVDVVFSSPIHLQANVSANVGLEAVQVFGSQTEYNRTVSIAGEECPLVEGCRVWFRVEPDAQGANHNYTVARVADSKNGFLVALREVSPHG
jgi:diaminopimelate decarboxylase